MRAWLLILLLLPAASAQTTYSLHGVVDAPDGLWTPLMAYPVVTSWTATCMVAAEAPPAPGAQGRLDVRQMSHDHVFLAGPNEYTVELPDCTTTQSVTWDAPFEGTVDRDQRGLLPTRPGVEARLTWPTLQGTGQTEANVTYQVTPDAFIVLEAKTPTKLQQGTPGSNTTFVFDITNFGNVAALVHVTTEPKMDHVDLWPPEPLEPFTMQRLELTITHPDSLGWDNDEQAFTVTLEPIVALDPETRGDTVRATVVARTQSDLGAPGPALPLVAVGLGAMAVAKRRMEGKREREAD